MPNTTSALTTAVGVIADIEGLSLSNEDQNFLLQPEISGLILFSRNYRDRQQLTELCASIKALRSDLLICVDQEGGRVQRFRQDFCRLPAMLTLENLYQQDKESALARAEDLGWLMALELIQCGVDLSFAPVLDIERGCSTVIGDRAFGHDGKTVTELAAAFICGMQSAPCAPCEETGVKKRQGMQAVGKHFPGHGAIAADSHLALPVDERSLADIEIDIAPFASLIQQNMLAGIMPAHVLYTQLDDQNTAGFSPYWLQTQLRKTLGFNGVIFSDDLSMAGAAAAGSFAQRSEKALAAGANALLACNNRQAAQEVIDTVRVYRQQNPQLVALDLSSWQLSARALNPSEQARYQRIVQSLLETA